MTPKEKANELFDKMFLIIENKGMYDDLYRAKQCALIAVDEIIKIEPYQRRFRLFDEVRFRDQTQYWIEVKQEIEAL